MLEYKSFKKYIKLLYIKVDYVIKETEVSIVKSRVLEHKNHITRNSYY